MAALLRGTSYHASRWGRQFFCETNLPAVGQSQQCDPPLCHCNTEATCINQPHPHALWCLERRQRTYLPADLCKEQGIQPEDVLSGRISDQLREVVFRIASCAKVIETRMAATWIRKCASQPLFLQHPYRSTVRPHTSPVL